MKYGEKSREELNKYAEREFAKCTSRKERRQLYDSVAAKFGIRENVVEPMITFKKDMGDFTAFEIFAVMYFLDRNSLSKFFTDKEITSLENEKIEEEKFSFPLVIENVRKVTDNQWITTTSASELMFWRSARLINYSASEQRALKKIKYGKEEFWKPYVNQKAVTEISNSMVAGTYIPDTITINLPEGSEFEFTENKLVISSLPNDMVNLIDGYHRYLAIARISDENDQFEYPMELRVVAFSQQEAEAFIFQQDQKTRMKKVVSDAYNPNATANKIVAQLNKDPMFYLNGKIGRNGELINGPYLAKLIEAFYLKGISKKEEVREILRVKAELVNKFNALIEQNPDYLNGMTDPQLCCGMYIFANKPEITDYNSAINMMIGKIQNPNKLNMGADGRIKKSLLQILEKAAE